MEIVVETAKREEMLRKLQNYNFAAYDLNLYLDTHPHDKKALEMFKEVTCKAKEAYVEFQKAFGPLTAMDNTQDVWAWGDNPWPWDFQ